ncbi:MAG: hypothetical protein J0M17_08240 [Planctomycetes bacterium]|nr:hypothetical protein [Planctomycetota bacterium]
MNRTLRTVRAVAIVPAIAALLMPANAHAIFGCLQRRNDAAAALYGSSVCTPQGQQLVANYIPQTCYRTQLVQVPVTTYRPVTSCDPCTGCQTVCMKPQVYYQQQVKYVPYSSYRIQYSLQQPTCGATATTYYAPTAAAAVAPAGGCSSCSSGAVNTTYYAPTAVAAPAPIAATVAPSLTYAAPAVARPATAYSYPTAPAGIGGYNYAPTYASGAVVAPNAVVQSAPSGQAVVSAYPGTVVQAYPSGTPVYGGATTTYNAPAYTAPATATPTYSYSAPATTTPTMPSTTTYAAPAPTQSTTVQPSPTPAPSLTTPVITNPAPALSGSTTLSAPSTTLAAPSTTLSAPSTPTVISGGSLTPVPESTFASPSPTSIMSLGAPSGGMSSGSTTSAYPSQPATNNPEVKSPYSSGIAPSTGTPTPIPALQGTIIPAVPTPLPSASPTPSSSRPPVIPMPDVEISGPRIGSPTSTPRLVDPEDKTASRWPSRVAYGYRVLPAMHASLNREQDHAVAATFVEAVAQPAVAGRSEIGQAPVVATLALPTAAPSAMIIEPAKPTRDIDGWMSSGR